MPFMGLNYRRRTVSEVRRRVYGSEVQIFTVSLNGANIFIYAEPQFNTVTVVALRAALIRPVIVGRFVAPGAPAYPARFRMMMPPTLPTFIVHCFWPSS